MSQIPPPPAGFTPINMSPMQQQGPSIPPPPPGFAQTNTFQNPENAEFDFIRRRVAPGVVVPEGFEDDIESLRATGLTPGNADMWAALHVAQENQAREQRGQPGLVPGEQLAISDIYKQYSGRSDMSNQDFYAQARQAQKESREGSMLGRAQNLGLNVLDNTAQKTYATVGAVAPKYANSLRDEYDAVLNPNRESGSGQVGQLLGEGAALATFMRAGGAAGMAGIYGVQGFGGTRQEVADLRDQGMDIGLYQELLSASKIGATEAVSGWVGGKIFKAMGGLATKLPGSAKLAIAQGSKTAITAAVKDGLKLAGGALAEGGEETVVQAITNYLRQGYNPDQAITEGMYEAFLAGVILSPFGTAGAIDARRAFEARQRGEGPTNIAPEILTAEAQRRGEQGLDGPENTDPQAPQPPTQIENTDPGAPAPTPEPTPGPTPQGLGYPGSTIQPEPPAGPTIPPGISPEEMVQTARARIEQLSTSVQAEPQAAQAEIQFLQNMIAQIEGQGAPQSPSAGPQVQPTQTPTQPLQAPQGLGYPGSTAQPGPQAVAQPAQAPKPTPSPAETGGQQAAPTGPIEEGSAVEFDNGAGPQRGQVVGKNGPYFLVKGEDGSTYPVDPSEASLVDPDEDLDEGPLLDAGNVSRGDGPPMRIEPSQLQGTDEQTAIQIVRQNPDPPVKRDKPLGPGQHTVSIDELVPQSKEGGAKISPERVAYHRKSPTRNIVPLVVNERADGSLVVTDGNHRLVAKALEGEGQVRIRIVKSEASAASIAKGKGQEPADRMKGIRKPQAEQPVQDMPKRKSPKEVLDAEQKANEEDRSSYMESLDTPRKKAIAEKLMSILDSVLAKQPGAVEAYGKLQDWFSNRENNFITDALPGRLGKFAFDLRNAAMDAREGVEEPGMRAALDELVNVAENTMQHITKMGKADPTNPDLDPEATGFERLSQGPPLDPTQGMSKSNWEKFLNQFDTSFDWINEQMAYDLQYLMADLKSGELLEGQGYRTQAKLDTMEGLEPDELGGTMDQMETGLFGQDVDKKDLPGPPKPAKPADRKRAKDRNDAIDKKIRDKFEDPDAAKLWQEQQDDHLYDSEVDNKEIPDEIPFTEADQREADSVWDERTRVWESKSGETTEVATVSPEMKKRIIRRVPLPELVAFAKKFLGPGNLHVKRMPKSLGAFYPSEGKVRINPIMAQNPIALAKTLAHEIGHAADWMPDQTMKKGNLLGRLKSVRSHMKRTLDNLDMKEIFPELYELSQEWRGRVDEKNDPPGYVNYRRSSVELYADFLSAILNDPRYAKKMAPKSYEAFMESFNKKPTVVEAYLDLQDILAGKHEDVIARRRADLRENRDRGRMIAEARAAEIRAGRQSLKSQMIQGWVDSAYPLMVLQNELKKRGIEIADEDNIDFAADEFALKDQEGGTMLNEVQETLEIAYEAGVTNDDISTFIMMNRIANGDRAKYINPNGYTQREAWDMMKQLMSALDPVQRRALHTATRRFLDLPYQMAKKLHEEGAYSDDQMARIEKNRGKYVVFQVLEKYDGKMSAAIRQQIGTFSDIADPLITTVQKMVAQGRLYEIQKFRNKAVKLLRQAGELEPVGRMKPGVTPAPPRDPNKANMAHIVNGKLVWYVTDKRFVNSFKSTDLGELSALAQFMDKITYGLFHKVFVTFNMSWMVANVMFRDPMRTYKSLKAYDPKVSVVQVYLELARAAKPAMQKQLGNYTEHVKEMMENRAIASIQMGDLQQIAEEGDYDRLIIKQFGSRKEARNKLVGFANKFLDAMVIMGNTTEAMSKIAGDKILMNNPNLSPAQRAHIVRNKVGTPNIYRKGTVTALTNRVFMYSKVMINGWKADADSALNKETRAGWWNGHMRVVGTKRLLMYAAAAGWLGAELEEWFKTVDQYDLKNYIIIPLGVTNEGKASYLRIPMDYTDQIISGMTWRMLDLMRENENQTLEQEMNEMFSFASGHGLSIAPPIDIALTWSKYLGGDNPVDSFTGRNILTAREQSARGVHGLNGMIQWTANELGVISQVLDVIPYFNEERHSSSPAWATYIPGAPRFIKETDRGIDQQRWQAIEQERREKDRLFLKLPSEVDKLLGERYRLQAFGKAEDGSPLTRKEHRNRAISNSFYKIYRSMLNGITAADARGDTEERDRLIGRLGEIADDYRVKMDAPLE